MEQAGRWRPRVARGSAPPSFALDFSRRGRDVTVAVRGEVDGVSTGILRTLLLDVVDGQGNLSVTVDLSGMTFIGSAGLGVFLEMHRLAVERGGSFVLRNPRPSAAKVFEIVGLREILSIA